MKLEVSSAVEPSELAKIVRQKLASLSRLDAPSVRDIRRDCSLVLGDKNGLADEIERVATEDAVEMTRRLAREEGLFAGTSTGGNVVAALRIAQQLKPNSTVVSVMCDTGMKYLSKH